MNFGWAKRKLRSLNWRRRRPEADSDVRHVLGSRGEREAARFLRRQGYRIISQNYDSPVGEVDLIATQGATIVFVEVKSRSVESEQDADHTVFWSQRKRIIQAARYFILRARADDRPVRFDVITVLDGRGGQPVVEHFVDAFQPGSFR